MALNYQGHGKPVFINEAKFRDNGACGFVLKPDFLRLPDFAKYSYLPTAGSAGQLHGLKDRYASVQKGRIYFRPVNKGVPPILAALVAAGPR